MSIRTLIFSLHLDYEVLYCPYLCADYLSPQELHFLFVVFFQDRKPAKQKSNLAVLKSRTVPDASNVLCCELWSTVSSIKQCLRSQDCHILSGSLCCGFTALVGTGCDKLQIVYVKITN